MISKPGRAVWSFVADLHTLAVIPGGLWLPESAGWLGQDVTGIGHLSDLKRVPLMQANVQASSLVGDILGGLFLGVAHGSHEPARQGLGHRLSLAVPTLLLNLATHILLVFCGSLEVTMEMFDGSLVFFLSPIRLGYLSSWLALFGVGMGFFVQYVMAWRLQTGTPCKKILATKYLFTQIMPKGRDHSRSASRKADRSQKPASTFLRDQGGRQDLPGRGELPDPACVGCFFWC
jgi:hypothetical protein